MRLQCMVLGLLFFGIGFFFFIGKAIPMLKGWKNLSEKQRKGINMRDAKKGRKVCRAV